MVVAKSLVGGVSILIVSFLLLVGIGVYDIVKAASKSDYSSYRSSRGYRSSGSEFDIEKTKEFLEEVGAPLAKATLLGYSAWSGCSIEIKSGREKQVIQWQDIAKRLNEINMFPWLLIGVAFLIGLWATQNLEGNDIFAASFGIFLVYVAIILLATQIAKFNFSIFMQEITISPVINFQHYLGYVLAPLLVAGGLNYFRKKK